MPSNQTSRRDVILEHMHDTTAFVVARSAPCEAIRDQEIAAVKPSTRTQKRGRVLRSVQPGELASLTLPKSWMLAVLLCPGDGTEEVASFMRSLGPAWRDRVTFYHVPKTDLTEAFNAWVAASLPLPLTETIERAGQLNAHLGAVLNEWIYQDHRPL